MTVSICVRKGVSLRSASSAFRIFAEEIIFMAPVIFSEEATEPMRPLSSLNVAISWNGLVGYMQGYWWSLISFALLSAVGELSGYVACGLCKFCCGVVSELACLDHIEHIGLVACMQHLEELFFKFGHLVEWHIV